VCRSRQTPVANAGASGIKLRKAKQGEENCFEARVEEQIFRGATDQLLLKTPSGLELTAVLANEGAGQEAIHKGDRVFCYVQPSDIVIVQEEQ
jgi:spermidine/putrescine transport system ATP-binding protein